MRKTITHVLAAIAVAASAVPFAANAQNIDFGDDSSRFSRDGECDDMRFSGPGMTDTTLIDSDIKHDATDCRTAYNQGRLTYNGGQRGSQPASNSGGSRIIWGDDASRFAKDGECDDKRFTGPGMTSTPLIDSDIKHDATDCRAAYNQGRLTLRQ
jgi:hypothetical protein